jgi:DNA replication and repair protein RecF
VTTVVPFKRTAQGETPEPSARARVGTLARLRLTTFRSYEALSLPVEGRPVVLTGVNGAGKTNLLEAISLFSPGRGLRCARLSELARQTEPGCNPSKSWAVAIRLYAPEGTRDLGTGQGLDSGERRQARIDGEAASVGAFSELLRVLWLTPAMDRLFVEGPGGRRRFLDRLALGLQPEHATHSARYARAMRERNILLRDAVDSSSWLFALESEMAIHGARIAEHRLTTVRRLGSVLAEQEGAFPRAALSLSGHIENDLVAGATPEEAESRFRLRLAQSRARDAAAGRALEGPHGSDLRVTHEGLGRDAEACSTGEQKALLLGLVLAQAQLVAAEAPGLGPVLLLDEVAAHLDGARREALFEAILALGLQSWLTGTDATLFAPLGRAAQHFTVARSRVMPAVRS